MNIKRIMSLSSLALVTMLSFNASAGNVNVNAIQTEIVDSKFIAGADLTLFNGESVVSTVLTAKDIDTITCKVLATFAGYSTDAIVIPQLAEMGITVDAAAPATRELIAFAAYLLAAE